MSHIELVIRTVKLLERLLRLNGATGEGLVNLALSVRHLFRKHEFQWLFNIADARNSLVHDWETDQLPDIAAFLRHGEWLSLHLEACLRDQEDEAKVAIPQPERRLVSAPCTDCGKRLRDCFRSTTGQACHRCQRIGA